MNQLAPIRPAEIADLDALVSLSRRTIPARYTSFLGAKVVQDYLASGAVEDFFKESLPRCFVVEEDGGVAGVGAYKGVMVDLMMIDAEHQGRGLGTRLLEHLETLLFEKSACPASAGNGEQRSAVKLTEGTHEKRRKHYTAQEKVAILRRHLVDKEPVSKLCDERALQPTVFYQDGVLPLAEGVL